MIKKKTLPRLSSQPGAYAIQETNHRGQELIFNTSWTSLSMPEAASRIE